MFKDKSEIEFLDKSLELTERAVNSLDSSDYNEAYASLGELHMDLSLLLEYIKKK